MKNIIILLGIVFISLTSCKITEKIYFEENGSGKYSIEMDMSKMMKSLSGMGDKPKIDSTYVAKDSIMKFSDMLIEHKDSIAKLPKEKQQLLKKMEDVVMAIHEDKRKDEMTMEIKGDFKDISELNELQNLLNATSPENKQIPSKYDISYTFKKNKFARKSTKKTFNDEQKEKFDKEMKGMSMFLEGSTYNLEYHFPKAIKKTNLENVKFSDDKKTIFIERTVDDWINNAATLDFEVKLKR